MHHGTGGGDPNSGSSDKRSELDDPVLAKLSPAERKRLESIGRSVSEAQRQLRDDEVDPALLKKLGMTVRQFKAFIEKYTERFGRIQPDPERTEQPRKTVKGAFKLPGSGELKKGRGVDGRIGNTRGTEDLTSDQIRKLYEAKVKDVSPEYRRHVEAYFRAIAESAGRAAPEGKTPATTRPR